MVQKILFSFALLLSFLIAFFFPEGKEAIQLEFLSKGISSIFFAITVPTLFFSILLGLDRLYAERRLSTFFKSLFILLGGSLVITLILTFASLLIFDPARVDLFIVPDGRQSTLFESLQLLTYLFPFQSIDLFHFENIYLSFLFALLFGFFFCIQERGKKEIYGLSIGLLDIANRFQRLLFRLLPLFILPFAIPFWRLFFSLFGSQTPSNALFVTWFYQFSGLVLVIVFIILPLTLLIFGRMRSTYSLYADFSFAFLAALVTGNSILTLATIYKLSMKKTKYPKCTTGVALSLTFWLCSFGTVLFSSLLFLSIIHYYTPLRISIGQIGSIVLTSQFLSFLPSKAEISPLLNQLELLRLFVLGGNIPSTALGSITLFIPIAQRLALFLNTAIIVIISDMIAQDFDKSS